MWRTKITVSLLKQAERAMHLHPSKVKQTDGEASRMGHHILLRLTLLTSCGALRIR
jgi:hypothetical protein